MPDTQYLAEEDVRSIVRLLGEVAGMDRDVPAKRRALAEGICKLVGGSVFVWINAAAPDGQRPMPYAFVDGGWDSDGSRDLLLRLSQDPDTADPAYDSLRQFTSHVTLHRRELTTSEQEQYYKNLLRPVGVDEELCSFYPLGEQGLFSLILIFRKRGQPAFTDRERLIFHILTSEVDWLHRDGVPSDGGRAVAALSPRQRQVLLFLLSGHPARHIAEQLELSTHTVNDYIRAIYEQFDVTSRAELLAIFLAGGRRQKQRRLSR